MSSKSGFDLVGHQQLARLVGLIDDHQHLDGTGQGIRPVAPAP